MVQYIPLLGDNYCKIFSETLKLYITSGKQKTDNTNLEWRERDLGISFTVLNI